MKLPFKTDKDEIHCEGQTWVKFAQDCVQCWTSVLVIKFLGSAIGVLQIGIHIKTASAMRPDKCQGNIFQIHSSLFYIPY
jgi:hypothetical protein